MAALARSIRPAGRRTRTDRIPGLQATVEVQWDAWGVPHVYAQSEHDLFLTEGYLHAEDRLWQMELHRRIAAGRLSELFGERTLEADRFLKRVGLYRAAQDELQTLDADALTMLEAYSEGVNARLLTHRGLPLELALLDIRPEPWRPVDCLTWAKLMGWGLSLNWDVELFRVRLAERLGVEAACALEWPYPTGHPFTASPGAAEPAHDPGPIAAEALAALFQGGGSNAWVVSATRSQTGKPLLANDPHLVPQLPSPWYEVHLECPTLRAAGASLPGAPGITIGHNERIAWGVTASMVDTQDLYLEQFLQDRPESYTTGPNTETATAIRESIMVRGRAHPVFEDVLVTRHGPIVTEKDPGTHQAYALRSTLLEPGRVAQSALMLLKATNWDGFRDALERWDAPSLNFVYADVEGNIGYHLAGRTPRRNRGGGVVPAPGWDPEYEWDGYLDPRDLPHALNPAEGYLATANNKPDEGEAIAGEWIDGYRAQRIIQLIEQTPRLSVQDMKRMHGDALSLPAVELQHLLRPLSGVADLKQVLEWDARMTPDSVVAAFYAALRVHLMRGLLTARAGEGAEAFLGMPVHPLASASSYQFRGTSGMFGLLRGALAQDSGAALVRRALDEALADLRARLGPDRTCWRWGRLHRVTFSHPMGAVKPLGRFLNRGPYPVTGDGDTVHQSSYSMREPYEANRWLPSLRFIADTSNWDNCLSVHAPGQSGRPGSRHYDDLIPLWLRGEYHPMPFSRAAVEAATAAVQTLVP